jgi:hypothetical protein
MPADLARPGHPGATVVQCDGRTVRRYVRCDGHEALKVTWSRTNGASGNPSPRTNSTINR